MYVRILVLNEFVLEQRDTETILMQVSLSVIFIDLNNKKALKSLYFTFASRIQEFSNQM